MTPSSSKFALGLVLLVVGLALACLGLWLSLSPAQYQATVRISFGVDDPKSYATFFPQTTFEVIRSDLVLGNTIESLRKDIQFEGKANAAITVKSLQRRIKCRAILNTRLIDISITDKNPELAARLANGIAQSYFNYRSRLNRERNVEAAKVYTAEYQEQTDKILAQQSNVAKLFQLVNQTNLVQSNPWFESNSIAYRDAKLQLGVAETQHDALKTRIAEFTATLQSLSASPLPPGFEIVFPATPPTTPIGPNRLLGVILLLFGLGIFLAGLRWASPGRVTPQTQP